MSGFLTGYLAIRWISAHHSIQDVTGPAITGLSFTLEKKARGCSTGDNYLRTA